MRRTVLFSSCIVTFGCSASPAEGMFGATATNSSESGPPGDDSSTDTVADASTSTSSESSSDSSTGPSTTGEHGQCGDGIVTADEMCDGTDFMGATCEALGFDGGILTCDGCTSIGTADCFACGNGSVEADEACDGTVGREITCASLGHTAGSVTCDPRTCQFDESACTQCGDGVAEGDEACDGVDLHEQDCATIGFSGGTLACNPRSCAFELGACTGGAYSQDFEVLGPPPSELPAEFTTGGNEGWIVMGDTDFTDPIAGSYSARSGDIDDGMVSQLYLDVAFSTRGSVTFMHRESTQLNADMLGFYIDGDLQEEWSGENASASATFAVDPGLHTFEWRYSRDGGLAGGYDWVWIDDIVLTNGVAVNP